MLTAGICICRSMWSQIRCRMIGKRTTTNEDILTKIIVYNKSSFLTKLKKRNTLLVTSQLQVLVFN